MGIVRPAAKVRSLLHPASLEACWGIKKYPEIEMRLWTFLERIGIVDGSSRHCRPDAKVRSLLHPAGPEAC